MKLPVIVFTRVHGKPLYDHGAQRWLDSYLKFRPETPHRVVIIDRYADSPDEMFSAVTSEHLRDDGGGWDCGAWQFAARNIETDLLICFNSSTQLMGPGWLERILESVASNGDGLYGPLSSLENQPHIRTPCMIFPPKVMQKYPHAVASREDTYRFESRGWPDGTPNVTLWARSIGLKTMLITWSGCYDLPEWRRPNVFRDGDQSDLMVFDRHCEAYAASDAAGKAYLEKLANGR
jgi:hypothetical protein